MVRFIRILEVPILLLVISIYCFENGSTAMGTFIMVISAIRLFTNHISDDTIYKK